MQRMTVDSAAIRLTETILGEEAPDLEQTLKALAANIGVLHIAYAPLCLQKSEDANLLKVPSRRWLELGWRVVSGLFNPNDSGVGALERRPRHDEGYHEGGGCGRRSFALVG